MAHIVVTPAEEDEVIVAGSAGVPAPGADCTVAAEGEIGAGLKPAAAPEPDLEPEPVLVDEPEAKVESGGASASEANRRMSPSVELRPTTAYHDPTLEDLKPAPMPLAQRIVVIAAVVCIIGALVYYFVAMR